MKKILLFLLVSMLIFSACSRQNVENSQGDEVTESSPEPGEEPGNSVEIVSEETKPGEYVPVMLNEYISKGTYYMKQKTTEDGKEVVFEVALDGNKAAKKDSTGTKVIEGETLYYVIPDQKLVLTSLVDKSMKEEFTSIINVKTEEEAKAAFVSTGQEKIKDTEYTYEEYKNHEGKLVRYYFDSKTIRYIKQINDDGTDKLIEILEFSANIPDGFFNVPDGYIVQDLSKIE
jgi:hypothetical protein